MDCPLHKRPYEFVCRATSCDLPLLCSECRKVHLMSSKGDRNVHTAQIMTLRHAFQQAERNITGNLSSLREMIMPFQNQQEIYQKIQEQKRRLLVERDEIIRRVTEVFNREIGDLQGRNKQTMMQNKQAIPFQEIKMRISKLEQLQNLFKFDANKLRQSLSHSEENYINQLRKNSSMLSSMKIQINEYYLYDQIKHDFFISQLQLRKRTLNNKLLQKVQNDSSLYFLIDQSNQGKYLHYFSPSENILRIYDLEQSQWKQIKCSVGNLPSFGATLYEHKSGRFYLIGGQMGYAKTNLIIWYSKQQGWRNANLTKPRSSAMATILYDKSGNHYILVAGGVGEDKKHMKDCQIYNPRTNTSFVVSSMNFAVTSGALVTFNQSIVFRIGGLGEFKQNMASICEIAQKCDFSRLLQNFNLNDNKPNLVDPKQFQKWTYMDIQVVNNDISKKFNLFYAHQAAIQINPNQIMVMGGMTHNSQGVKQTYILQIQSIKNRQNNESFRYYARWINQKPLVSAEGFISLRPIIYNKKIYSLQNISSGPNQYYQKQKRLIQFNMYDWREIQNIVNI